MHYRPEAEEHRDPTLRAALDHPPYEFRLPFYDWEPVMDFVRGRCNKEYAYFLTG